MLDPVGASMGQADHDASAEAAQPFTEPVVDSGATVDAVVGVTSVSYTHLRAHETVLDLVCRLLLEKKKHTQRHLVI